MDEFLNTYDPDKDYQPYAEAVVEPPKRRMPLEGAEQYYNQYPDIPPEVIDEILTQCGTNCNITETLNTFRNDPANFQIYQSIGIPKWQDTYPEAHGYSSGVWSTTIGGLIDLGKALKKDFWGTSKAVGKGLVQSLDRGMIMTNPLYATQRFIGKFGKDMKSYYGSATQQVLKGNIKQGVSDFINIPKFLGFLVNKNYSGGKKQLVKDTQNPIKVTSWMVQAGAISQETAKAYQQGNYRYASSRAAGEATGYVFWYVASKGIISGVSKVSQALTKQTIIQQAIQSSVPRGKIGSVAKDIEQFLGRDIKVITNQSGDKVFINSDNSRKIRFDIKNYHPHEGPHVDIEIKNANGNWKKIKGPIYPKDAK